jgi:S1/P1 Nuclease
VKTARPRTHRVRITNAITTGIKSRTLVASANLTRLRNEATALRNRQGFHRSQLTELANTDFESWAKESFEIATKIAYRNGGRIGTPKAGATDCTMVATAPALPVGYVVSSSRIADRRMILAGYRLADLLIRMAQN